MRREAKALGLLAVLLPASLAGCAKILGIGDVPTPLTLDGGGDEPPVSGEGSTDGPRDALVDESVVGEAAGKDDAGIAADADAAADATTAGDAPLVEDSPPGADARDAGTATDARDADTGTDAAVDARETGTGIDSGVDSGVDANLNADAGPACVTTIADLDPDGGGRLLFSFDNGNISSSSGSWRFLASAYASATIVGTTADGHVCPGALEIDSQYMSGSAAGTSADFDYATATDWTGFAALHFWVRFHGDIVASNATSGTIFLYVYSAMGHYRQIMMPFSTFADEQWHRVDFDLTPSTILGDYYDPTSVTEITIDFTATPSADAAAQGGVMLVDDVWLQ